MAVAKRPAYCRAERSVQVPREGVTSMSTKVVFAAALFAAFVIAGPATRAAAQTSPAKEETKKAQDAVMKMKADADEKKAQAADKAAEKKAAKAEKKAKASDARKAAHARQKQCGSEWKEARAAGKVEKTMTWPKYYSECNKRLKDKAT